MKVVDNFGTDFVIIENPVEYLNAFIWLTTTKMQDIGKMKLNRNIFLDLVLQFQK